MATLYVSEYARQALDNHGAPIAAGEEPPLASQTVAIAVGSTASGAFNLKTRFVRLHADVVCSFKFGTGTPVAVATDARMGANQTEYFGVLEQAVRDPAGFKVAVIQNT